MQLGGIIGEIIPALKIAFFKARAEGIKRGVEKGTKTVKKGLTAVTNTTPSLVGKAAEYYTR